MQWCLTATCCIALHLKCIGLNGLVAMSLQHEGFGRCIRLPSGVRAVYHCISHELAPFPASATKLWFSNGWAYFTSSASGAVEWLEDHLCFAIGRRDSAEAVQQLFHDNNKDYHSLRFLRVSYLM